MQQRRKGVFDGATGNEAQLELELEAIEHFRPSPQVVRRSSSVAEGGRTLTPKWMLRWPSRTFAGLQLRPSNLKLQMSLKVEPALTVHVTVPSVNWVTT